jgi:diguanylate cyclase (GGDEF)-like protein
MFREPEEAMSDRLGPIRAYFARTADPYAGGDLPNAQRMGAVLWMLVLVLTLVLLPLSAPDDPIGGAGWIAAGFVLAANAALVVALRRGRLGSWDALLAVSYLAVVGIATIQWLAESVSAPYNGLLFLTVLFVAALHPPRRIAPFMAVVLIATAAPLIYDGWSSESAGSSGASFVIWCALAVIVSLLMTGIRAQRVAHARDEAEAREEARLDALTGLHNRRGFDEALQREVEIARRRGASLSVGMVDVENFKQINDRWGYSEGDRCLREVAAALRDSLRQPDLCFRWGGDEFSLILPATSATEAVAIGERLRDVITGTCCRPNEEPIQARFAVAELLDEMDPQELVEMAGIELTAARSDSA